jgi:hypothetical protein
MNSSTGQQEPFTGIAIEDIILDGNGHVTIGNPQVAERLRVGLAAKRQKSGPKGPPKPNTNCNGCNTTTGCGGDNMICKPNTKPNCGCRLA